MPGDRRPERVKPEVSPQAVVELVALTVTMMRDRVTDWPANLLLDIHEMAMDMADVAMKALSGQLPAVDAEDPGSP